MTRRPVVNSAGQPARIRRDGTVLIGDRTIGGVYLTHGEYWRAIPPSTWVENPTADAHADGTSHSSRWWAVAELVRVDEETS